MKMAESQYTESIKIVSIQMPFFPVVIHPELNLLSEPDGGINYWLLGEKKLLNLLPISSLGISSSRNYITRILDFLLNEYHQWIFKTLTEILDRIISEKNPDIILFPEYSLPIYSSPEIKELLKQKSENRCIIGGIGSHFHEGKKTNEFIIINNGNVRTGAKLVPNEDEKQLGITGGEGPLVFEISLTRDEGQWEIYIEINMCSDFIDSVAGGTSIVSKRVMKDLGQIDPNAIK